MVQCPAHPDRTPSLSVRRIPDTAVITLHCFAGCSAQEISQYIPPHLIDPEREIPEELTKRFQSLNSDQKTSFYASPFSNLPQNPPLLDTVPFRFPPGVGLKEIYFHLDRAFALGELCGPPTGIWLYEDPEPSKAGLYHFAFARYETHLGKDYRPWTRVPINPEGGEEWNTRFPKSPRILWNLPDVVKRANQAKRILLCEGELSAESASVLFPDIPVTTWATGSKSIDKSSFDFLQRFPEAKILIWPDPDIAGDKCQKLLEKKLESLNIQHESPNFADLFQKKEDAADVLRFLGESITPLKLPKIPGIAPEIAHKAQEKSISLRQNLDHGHILAIK